MKIYTYTSEDAPAKVSVIAKIGTDRITLLPIAFYAPDAATAKANAKTWWDSETKKAKDGKPKLAKPSVAPLKGQTVMPPVPDDDSEEDKLIPFVADDDEDEDDLL